MFERELAALARAGRLRQRKLFHADHPKIIDLASNDYLNLAHKKKLFKAAIGTLKNYGCYGPKASQLVSGYHPIHERFEAFLTRTQGFESALVVGSGFLGNLALFETLVRRNDVLLIDEQYHASGILAAKTVAGQVHSFKHNDPADLARQLKNIRAKRIFIAVEGVYSMGGDLLCREILTIAREASAVLILDEAHSSGVLGKRLQGILDHYEIADRAGIIKLGTLGKAYGSYGAYILAETDTIRFLENRAKAVIYTTAPSLYDIAYAHAAAEYIHTHGTKLLRRLDQARGVAARYGYETQTPILPIQLINDAAAIAAQDALLDAGFLVGAIRRPTVSTPQLRIILRQKKSNLNHFFQTLQHLKPLVLKSPSRR